MLIRENPGWVSRVFKGGVLSSHYGGQIIRSTKHNTPKKHTQRKLQEKGLLIILQALLYPVAYKRRESGKGKE